MSYKAGTVTTVANNATITGTNTQWANPLYNVVKGQIIVITQGTNTDIYTIEEVKSNTSILLSRPAVRAATNATYEILTTLNNSVSDDTIKLGNEIVAMSDFMRIMQAWTTSSQNTIKVTWGSQEITIATVAGLQNQINRKFDKTGGEVEGGVTATALGSTSKQTNSTIFLYPAPESSPDGYAYFQYLIKGKWFGHVEIPRPANGKTRLMQVGDFGLGSNGLSYSVDQCAFIAASSDAARDALGVPALGAGVQTVYTNQRRAQLFINTSGALYVRFSMKNGLDTTTLWNEVYTTKNTTKDSNGNLKAASPVVKLFADHIELNEESEGVEMEHLGVGHYLIKGVVGFNADGAWGINNGFVIPQDHNGKNMVLIDYKVKPDGDIELFVFHQQNADMPERFQNKRIKYIDEDGNPVYYENYEPCDVPESRWIDMRVEMPVNSLYNKRRKAIERAQLYAELTQYQQDILNNNILQLK